MRRREGRLLFIHDNRMLAERAFYCFIRNCVLWNKKDTSHCDVSYRAGKETWTLMILLSYGPEPYASANSAIPAFVFQCSARYQCCSLLTKDILSQLWQQRKSFFYFFTVLSWLLLCNWRRRTVTLTESSVPDLLPDAQNALPPHARRLCNPSLQSHLPYRKSPGLR